MELVIVEKRSMAQILSNALSDKTRNRKYFLESDKRIYFFTSGHLINLSEKYRSWDIESVFRIVAGQIKEDIKDALMIKELKKIVPTTERITLATDYDTEGEVIGRDVLGLIKNKNLEIKRWKFSSLTKEDLIKSYSLREDLCNTDILYYKGYSRRYCDFIEGVSATKLINLGIIVKESGENSFYRIGRVKAGIMRILDERKNLVEYYLKNPHYNYYLSLNTLSGIRLQVPLPGMIEINSLKVTDIKIKEKTVVNSPPLPYNTKRLIQRLSLKYTPGFIKTGLETLYSRGIITYPRTDTELFNNDFYDQVVNNSKLPLDSLKDKFQFKRISIGNSTVDHPAISPTFKETVYPPAYLLFTKQLINILLEPILKEKITIVPYLEIRVDKYVFTTQNPANFEKIKTEDLFFNIEKRRYFKRNYTLSELFKTMSKHNIGTKSTQLVSVCDLQDSNIIKLKDHVEGNFIIINEVLKRLSILSGQAMLFNLDYCAEIQKKIDSISNKIELKKLIIEIKRKWKEIAQLVKERT